MGDLSNKFPTWGEVGELPPDGFFYEGGDRVNEKHLDSLWNTIDEQINQLIQGQKDRVRYLHGDTVFGSGLETTRGTNEREIDVSGANSAFTNGQLVKDISGTTKTLSANSSSSTRTDSVWTDENGQIGVSEDTTTVAGDRHQIAEVDIATDDTISEIRNITRREIYSSSSEIAPFGYRPGDRWYDEINDLLKIRTGGAWRTVLLADGTYNATGPITFEDDLLSSSGTTIWDSANNYVPTGSLQQISLGGDTDGDLAGTDLSDGSTTIWNSTNGYIPQSSVQQGDGSGLDADTVDGKEPSEISTENAIAADFIGF